MRRVHLGAAPMLVSGLLLAASVVAGLPPPVALPLLGTALLLLVLVVHRQPVAATAMIVLMVVTAAVRYQLHPDVRPVLVTATLLVLFVVTSLPFSIDGGVSALAALGLSAAAGCVSAVLLLLARTAEAHGPLTYLVALVAAAAAYGLAMPTRRGSVHSFDRGAEGGA